MSVSDTDILVSTLQDVELTFGQTVQGSMFGGDMLRFTETSTFEESAQILGLTTVRWPGGLIVDPNYSFSSGPDSNRWVDTVDENGWPDSYVYDLTHDNIIETTGWPRDGLSEALEFAVSNNLRFTMLLPEDRYMKVDQNVEIPTISIDLEKAKSDYGIFLERLLSGHFGEVPKSFSLQFGQEYYSGMIQKFVDQDVVSHSEHLKALGCFYDELAQFIKSTVEELTLGELNPEGVSPQLNIHMGRLFGDPEKSVGSFDDAHLLSQQFGTRGLEAIDGLLIQRYVPNLEMVSKGFSQDIYGHTLNDVHAVWSNAALRLGIENKQFDIIAGWAKSSLTEQEIREDFGDEISNQQFVDRSNFEFELYKQHRWDDGQDYGAKHPVLILQMFAELVSAGAGEATYYGIGTNLPGRLSGKDVSGETVIFAAGTLLQMMSERLPGTILSSATTKNNYNYAGGVLELNSIQFENATQIVSYYWLVEDPKESVTLNLLPNGEGNLSDAFSTATVRTLTSVPLDGWQERFGVTNLDEVWGYGFQDAEAKQYYVADTNDITPEIYNLESGDDKVSISFSQDYQIVEVTYAKDPSGIEIWKKQFATSGDYIGTDKEDQFVGDLETNSVFLGVGDDVANGAGGDDRLFGQSGDDLLSGGVGNDVIDGGDDDDKISGGQGTDYLAGGSGDDLVNGGAGNDLIFGNNGDDNITGDQGNDTLYGGGGNDVIKGNDGSDIIDGDYGNDILVGGVGNDQLNGGNGADYLLGGAGNDQLLGGQGPDTFVFSSSSGNDTIQDFSTLSGDRIDLSILGIESLETLHQFAEVTMHQGDLHLEFEGNNTVTLLDFDLAGLSEDIFTY